MSITSSPFLNREVLDLTVEEVEKYAPSSQLESPFLTHQFSNEEDSESEHLIEEWGENEMEDAWEEMEEMEDESLVEEELLYSEEEDESLYEDENDTFVNEDGEDSEDESEFETLRYEDEMDLEDDLAKDQFIRENDEYYNADEDEESDFEQLQVAPQSSTKPLKISKKTRFRWRSVVDKAVRKQFSLTGPSLKGRVKYYSSNVFAQKFPRSAIPDVLLKLFLLPNLTVSNILFAHGKVFSHSTLGVPTEARVKSIKQLIAQGIKADRFKILTPRPSTITPRELIANFIQGFTTSRGARTKRRVIMQLPNTVGVLTHEACHFYVHWRYRSWSASKSKDKYFVDMRVSDILYEGFAEYFARQVMRAHANLLGPHTPSEYMVYVRATERIITTIGEATARAAYFEGNKRALVKLFKAIDANIKAYPLLVPGYAIGNGVQKEFDSVSNGMELEDIDYHTDDESDDRELQDDGYEDDEFDYLEFDEEWSDELEDPSEGFEKRQMVRQIQEDGLKVHSQAKALSYEQEVGGAVCNPITKAKVKPAIGFEFDINYGSTEDSVPPPHPDYSREGKKITKHKKSVHGFRLKGDGNRIEIGTIPFDFTNSGRIEMENVMNQIQQLIKKITNVCERTRPARSLGYNKKTGPPRYFEPPEKKKKVGSIFPLSFYPRKQPYYARGCRMGASPQATLTIPLGKVNKLVTVIKSSEKYGWAPGKALSGPRRARQGTRSVALYDAQQMINISRNWHIKHRTKLSDGSEVTTSNFTPTLQGLLILMLSYLRTSELKYSARRDYEIFAKAYLPLNVKNPMRLLYSDLTPSEKRVFKELYYNPAAGVKRVLWRLAKKNASLSDKDNQLFPAKVAGHQKLWFTDPPTWGDFMNKTVNNIPLLREVDHHVGKGKGEFVGCEVLWAPLSRLMPHEAGSRNVTLEMRRLGFDWVRSYRWKAMVRTLYRIGKELNS